MTAYDVVVTREGDTWLAEVLHLEGTQTWARNLQTLDREVREAIALTEDLPEGAEPNLELRYDYRTGDPELNSAAAELRAERSRLSALEESLLRRTRGLVEQLTETGYSVRDTARLVGVAPQRVSQIAPRAQRRTDEVKPKG